MDKYGLVGKNISHSRSPEIYKNLLVNIEYDLLDYSNEKDIPSASELLSQYKGINITSPYKEHFLNEVKLTPIADKLKAINCLTSKNNEMWGENTDYLAVLEILKRMKQHYPDLFVTILGDGVMSRVTILALTELRMPWEIFSRKKVDCFSRLNLSAVKPNSTSLIINTCSRDFIFAGELNPNSIFWDYNYNFEMHSKLIPPMVTEYIDGAEMLKLQAQYAVAFWSDV